MNAQTTMTVRKAIQYMQQNAGRERLVGGSIPEDAGLVVALKPGVTEHHGSNGTSANGANGTSGTSGTNDTHAPGAGGPSALQGILVIPNPGSDYGLIMEQLYDGSRVGTAGDYIGRKTRIEILEWREEEIEADGSLSDGYVASLSDKLLSHAITADDSYAASTPGSTGPTPTSEQTTDELPPVELDGESSDVDSEAQEVEAPQAEAPQPEEQEVEASQPEAPQAEASQEEAHEQIDQALPGDIREPEAGQVEAGDQVGIGQTEAPEEPDEADERAEEQARALRSWIHSQTERTEQEVDSGHDAGADQEPAGRTSPETNDATRGHAGETPAQDVRPAAGGQDSPEPGSSDPKEAGTATIARGPYYPEVHTTDHAATTGSTSEERIESGSEAPTGSRTESRSETATAGPAPGAAPYSADSARRREALDEEAGSGTEGTKAGKAGNGTNGTSDNAANSRDNNGTGAPAAENRYPGEYGTHIRSGLQEYHPEEEATLDSRTHDWLAALSTGKTQTPEQRQYLIAKHNSKKMASRLTFRKKPVPPPQLASIPQPETGAIDHIAESDRGPGVVVPMISKGGTGKTTVSIETAFALAMMFGAHGNNTASRTGRVLLLDMNLTNPDLAHRIAVDGPGTSGLKDLINGDHLSRVVNRTALPNLDVLFLLGRRDNDKGILPDVLGDPYAMNSLITAFLTNPAYDAIVVDTANTLPGEEDNPASYAMTMWANMADARYLVLQPEIASFRNASLFATRLTEALGYENSELVPLLNSLPGKKVYEEAPITSAMAQKRRATLESVEVLERDTSIHVVKPMGQHQSQHLTHPLIIPDYPEEVRGFAAEGRPISMFSQTFANAYSRIALDAVRRMVNNRTRDPNRHEDDN